MIGRSHFAQALALAAAASLIASPAFAQDLPNVPGKVLDFPKPTAHVALAANAHRIAQVILAKPSLTAPVGFSIRPSLQLKTPLENMPAGTPDIARVVLLFQKIDPGARKAAGEGSGMGPTIIIDINDHTALFDDAPSDVRVQQRIAVRGAEVRNGFQVFQRANTVTLVLAKTDRPLFRPVTRAEYIFDLITAKEEAIAELAKVTTPTELRADVAALRTEISALSPAEASAPACESDSGGARFKRCEADDFMIARVNPDYFDRNAPNSSVQLIAINYNAAERGGLREPVRAAISALTADDLSAQIRR